MRSKITQPRLNDKNDISQLEIQDHTRTNITLNARSTRNTTVNARPIIELNEQYWNERRNLKKQLGELKKELGELQQELHGKAMENQGLQSENDWLKKQLWPGDGDAVSELDDSDEEDAISGQCMSPPKQRRRRRQALSFSNNDEENKQEEAIENLPQKEDSEDQKTGYTSCLTDGQLKSTTVRGIDIGPQIRRPKSLPNTSATESGIDIGKKSKRRRHTSLPNTFMSNLALRHGVVNTHHESYRSTGGDTLFLEESKAFTRYDNIDNNNRNGKAGKVRDNQNLASALSQLHLDEISTPKKGKSEAAKEETASNHWNLWGMFSVTGTNNDQNEERTKELSHESLSSEYFVHGTAKTPSIESRRNVMTEQSKSGAVLVPKRLSHK